MSKEIYDPVHDFITITPLMRQIIDTPEMQRLRDLKQLGAAHYVFPSAVHTRFAHSIGVSYLAGKIMKILQQNQKRLQITDRTIEIARIAGLVHDIGHGPFSHLYDQHIRARNEDNHEKRGCQLFRKMVLKYNLCLHPHEVDQIVMMINPTIQLQSYWPYQIIANKLCQIDVDKLDYIRRDCYHLGIQMCDTFTRLITKVRVVKTSTGGEVLAWPKKLEFDIFNMFATRYRLHKQIYHHHAINAYNFVIVEIMRKHRKNKGMDCWQLTDSNIICGLNEECRHLHHKLLTRDVPKLVGEKVLMKPNAGYGDDGPNPRVFLDTIVQKVEIGFSSGLTNPLYEVFYYTKNNIDIGHQSNPQENSFCVPQQFKETIVRMYTKSNDFVAAQKEWDILKQRM